MQFAWTPPHWNYSGQKDMTRTSGIEVGGPERTRWGWDAFWIGLIVIVAFVLRWIYLQQVRENPYFDSPVMDPAYHHEWARAFARGEIFWKGAYFRAPLYPWFLGLIYKIFGSDNLLVPRIVQIAIGSINCVLTYLIGRTAFSRAVGVVAGLAAATYWIFMYFEAELLLSVLEVFFYLLLLLLLLWTGERRGASAWILCGAAMGVAAIVRPNILLLAPALVGWVFLLHKPRWKKAAGYSICLFLGTIAPILPVTIRNYLADGEFTLISTQGGVNFYIGNNPNSNGMTAVILGDPAAWEPCYEAQIARAEKAEGRKLTGSEVSRWYARQALRFWTHQPLKAAALTLRKLGYFWSNWEIANNEDSYFVRHYFTPIGRYLPVGFWLFGPLGALGLCLSLSSARRLFPLWGFVLIYTLSVVAFFVCDRFRVPVIPVLMILGAHAVLWAWRTLRAGRWGRLCAAGLVVAAMGLVAAIEPEGADALMLQQHESTGIKLANVGRYEEAERILSELIRRADSIGETLHPKNWYWLGFVRVKLDRYEEAVPCFERALSLRSFYPEARTYLGYSLAALGRLEEALPHFERNVRDIPDSGPARVNLGVTLARMERIDEALPHWIRAIELNPEHAAGLSETVAVMISQGKQPAALSLLRAVAERFPEHPLVAADLIRTLADSGEDADRLEASRLGQSTLQRLGLRDPNFLAACAWAEYRSGNHSEARRLGRRALEIARQRGDREDVLKLEEALRRYESPEQP